MWNELLLDPKYWRDRAEEARAMAADLKNHDAAEALHTVARSYDRVAEVAEREKSRAKSKPSS